MRTNINASLRLVNPSNMIPARVNSGIPVEFYSKKSNQELYKLIRDGFLYQSSADAVMQVLVTRLQAAEKLVRMLAGESEASPVLNQILGTSSKQSLEN